MPSQRDLERDYWDTHAPNLWAMRNAEAHADPYRGKVDGCYWDSESGGYRPIYEQDMIEIGRRIYENR